MNPLQNKRCPTCNWRTHSSISRNYHYCPICSTPLETYIMGENHA